MTGKEILRSEPVKRFQDYFGIIVDPEKESKKYIEAIKEINPRTPKTAGESYKSRQELELDETVWPEEAIKAIRECAQYMGMYDFETPIEGEYAAVFPLGAARQAPLDRVLYTLELVRSRRLQTREIVVVGSTRKISDAEKENVLNYAPGAETEYDLCVGAVDYAIANFVRIYALPYGLRIYAEKINSEKARTPDVLKGIIYRLKRRNLLSQKSRVGVVVTQIYRQFTELETARVAKGKLAGYAIAGNPSDPSVAAKRSKATILSEVIRALEAATRAARSGV